MSVYQALQRWKENDLDARAYQKHIDDQMKNKIQNQFNIMTKINKGKAPGSNGILGKMLAGVQEKYNEAVQNTEEKSPIPKKSGMNLLRIAHNLEQLQV